MNEMRPIKEGKVREIYDNGDSLIMVATDRISCFDVILKNEITKKGSVLTQMSRFWFDMTKDILPNHMISVDVKDMPDGIDTLIGENGTALSGGQRQRVALARALYKEFELLIMDEATAALDVETETAVMRDIYRMDGNKTVLLVTHHLNLAEGCEFVYKIEDKKLVRIR